MQIFIGFWEELDMFPWAGREIDRQLKALKKFNAFNKSLSDLFNITGANSKRGI